MHPTKIDIAENARKAVVSILQARLGDAIDLASQMKQAHWNVKGPNFIALHELFDQVHTAVSGHVDTIAERITTLGGVAEGTVRAVAGRSKLKEYQLQIVDGTDHVDAVSTVLAAFGKAARADIDETAKIGDAVTADLFTEVSSDIDKQLWLVEAHAQAKR